ncbi:hypothetical protein AAFF_G00201990 [Aldrovandia affinis]|uniref:Uncharacterized protein n=1 Tax=Aldrovandia affinis TaxID=143900 RepID=A0AAD7WV64_9TELE|nr:hypothetical protein AAFF_G00201990 [Aldrovandia affinis]
MSGTKQLTSQLLSLEGRRATTSIKGTRLWRGDFRDGAQSRNTRHAKQTKLHRVKKERRKKDQRQGEQREEESRHFCDSDHRV